ncbi:MAG: alpha/beta hydrolase [Methylomicrobium sp.]
MKSNFDCVEINPKSQHRRTVIWLHGLGADGHDFEGIIPELDLPEAAGIRFCFPNAPVRPITINGGFAMRAWYDIADMSLQRQVDKTGIDASSASILALIDEEIERGIPSNNIVLAGFSQGGVIALDAGLQCPQPLAGIIALSAYWPTYPDIVPRLAEANRSTPILVAHGTMDTVVDVAAGKAAFEALQTLQYPAIWRDYPMAHSVCFEEIRDIAAFLTQCFGVAGRGHE